VFMQVCKCSNNSARVRLAEVIAKLGVDYTRICVNVGLPLTTFFNWIPFGYLWI